jgi:uncharacterized protein with FMN-binding domain
MRELADLTDRKWFSYLKNLTEEMGYGNLDLSVTVKNGQVTHIKVKSESSFSIHNS